MVPNLLLQPLVENAIFHGFLEEIENPKLVVFGYREGDDLILKVVDNGIGINKEVLEILNILPLLLQA